MRLIASLLLPLVTWSCGESGDSAPSRSPASPPHEPTTEAAEEAAPAPPGVLETFQVGENVYVRSLAVEPERDALWVGTSVGVLEIDLNTREMRSQFTRQQGLANEYVFAIGVDSHGNKWFGTNGGGVSRYKDGQWETFFPMHGLADYWIYAFAEQDDGSYWVGTWAGVNRLNLDTMEFTTYKDELINEWVYGIGIDSRDRIWFGTEGGISMYDGQSWQHWTHDDGLGAPNTEDLPSSTNTGLGTRSRHDLNVRAQGMETYNPNYVFAVLVDPNDVVWAGTWGGGVARYDGKSWSNFTTEDGLAGDIVYSIAREPDGTFWFGTNKGLTRYDGESWHTYGTADGLPAPHVYAIVVIPGGDVWAGTKMGVVRLGFPGDPSE
ncbi:MAG: regulator [Gammaproteobacteria bacterium]|nr:regulator [Gammaproteobacteria bacterium]NIR98494.1 regulator [Gammaproteobacteria bacterium]NIT64238.1 regulator [Gammaproteobacteria bacterium]NIV21182.1 regulator [Gammaproteobacteria bacterium]NIX10103.1 regulator [Gammaproteobacteria bacterium]